MKKINEIFYSLQGEGYYSGHPAVFIRFSGCNLKCPFCDTQHNDGKKMTDEEIVEEVKKYPTRLVVITGGEPSLYLDEEFIKKLRLAGINTVAVETNGTHRLPRNVDYITCSPKFEYCDNAEVVLSRIDEIKVVWNMKNDMEKYKSLKATRRYLQPCDVQDEKKNKEIQESAVMYCLQNPEWNLSLQTQKILGVR